MAVVSGEQSREQRAKAELDAAIARAGRGFRGANVHIVVEDTPEGREVDVDVQEHGRRLPGPPER